MNEMSREDLKTWQQELKSKTATLNDLREQEKEIEQKIIALRESAPSMQVALCTCSSAATALTAANFRRSSTRRGSFGPKRERSRLP
jgi:septal ring factor EnvC (AmiA/AmiB activator)